jgi:hypothetical protein
LVMIITGGFLNSNTIQCSFLSSFINAITYMSGGIASVCGYIGLNEQTNKPVGTIAVIAAGIGIASYWYQRTQRAELLNGISNNDFNRVKQALQRGANPNTDCGFVLYGRTALMYAIVDGQILNKNVEHTDQQIIELLIEYGADVNKTDYYGITPLMLVECWHEDSVFLAKLLLEKGAHVNSQVPIPKFEMYIFPGRSDEDIAYLYTWYGAFPGQTALHTARTPEIYKILIDAGAETDVIDYFGNKPRQPEPRKEYSSAYKAAIASRDKIEAV